MSAAVVRADALRLPLADASVDLIVTSPPYFALRSYRDEGEHYANQLGSEATPQAFLEALWAVTAECWRVLKPTGSMFVNLGDKYSGSVPGGPSKMDGTSGKARDVAAQSAKGSGGGYYVKASTHIPAKSLMGLPWRYAIGCIDGEAAPGGQRWILRAEVIWSKPNGLPESVTDRVRRSHEQWFHMVKSPRYFSAVDEVREQDIAASTIARFGDATQAERVTPRKAKLGTPSTDVGRATKSFEDWHRNPLGKLPGSVWSIPSEPLIIPEAAARHYDLPDHFAAFPQEWPRRIILGWSPSGICLECGEGRRPVVAKDRQPTQRVHNGHGFMSPNHGNRDPLPHRTEATITGYACACPDATASTTPARVLDPFGGTGTTAMVARTLGRFGVSVDLSADYCRLSRWRIFESGHGEKAAQRTHRDNQGDLFRNGPSVHCEDVVIAAELL